MYQEADNKIDTLDYMQLSTEFSEYSSANIPGAVVWIDALNMEMVSANGQFYNFFEFTPHDIVGRPSFLDLFEPNQKEYFKARLQTTVNDTNRNNYTVYKLHTKNNAVLQCYVYQPVKVTAAISGENIYQVFILPDWSKKELLFNSSATRDILMERLNNEIIGTYEWQKDADSIFCSPGIYRMWDIDPAQKVTASTLLKRVCNDQESYNAIQNLRQAITDGKDTQIKIRIKLPDNAVKTLEVFARPVVDAQGGAIKLIGTVFDITKQQNAEQDIKTNVDELNRSNRELEEFAYVASHDMQEPLRKITTFSDRLSDKYKNVLTGDGIMYLDRMMVSAENMRLLINNLLEFSRIAKSTQPFTQLNLNFLVHQVKSDLELIIEETGTVINTNNDLPVIDALITQMKQLFTNIINNAIKFRKPDVPPVINITSVRLQETDVSSYGLMPHKVYYKIQIEDNGIGFENEYAQRIFQIFQRLHGKSEYPGSGIGLAICKKIVEHHHGLIFAESVIGQGAKFTFILPEIQ